jgi:hypothetical protein
MSKIRTTGGGTKKEAIIKKAAMLFCRKGFASSSMRELADLVGVEAPSLYNHIGSKSEILQAICFQVANEFNNHLIKINKTTLSSSQKVETIIRFHIHMMLHSYDAVFVANHEWKQLADPFLSNFLNQRKLYENTLVSIVEEGIIKKEFKKLDPYVAVLTILSAVRGLEFWFRHRRNIREKELEDNMVIHLMNGLNK